LAVYPRENLDWADHGALRAAVAPPARTSLTVATDAIVAHHAGLRALSLVSIDEQGTLGPHYHQPTDTPENVEFDSVEVCTRLAAGIAHVGRRRLTELLVESSEDRVEAARHPGAAA
jgi:hypothetical protein